MPRLHAARGLEVCESPTPNPQARNPKPQTAKSAADPPGLNLEFQSYSTPAEKRSAQIRCFISGLQCIHELQTVRVLGVTGVTRRFKMWGLGFSLDLYCRSSLQLLWSGTIQNSKSETTLNPKPQTLSLDSDSKVRGTG